MSNTHDLHRLVTIQVMSIGQPSVFRSYGRQRSKRQLRLFSPRSILLINVQVTTQCFTTHAETVHLQPYMSQVYTVVRPSTWCSRSLSLSHLSSLRYSRLDANAASSITNTNGEPLSSMDSAWPRERTKQLKTDWTCNCTCFIELAPAGVGAWCVRWCAREWMVRTRVHGLRVRGRCARWGGREWMVRALGRAWVDGARVGSRVSVWCARCGCARECTVCAYVDVARVGAGVSGWFARWFARECMVCALVRTWVCGLRVRGCCARWGGCGVWHGPMALPWGPVPHPGCAIAASGPGRPSCTSPPWPASPADGSTPTDPANKRLVFSLAQHKRHSLWPTFQKMEFMRLNPPLINSFVLFQPATFKFCS